MTVAWVIAGVGAVALLAAVIHSDRAHRAHLRADRERFEQRIVLHERRR